VRVDGAVLLPESYGEFGDLAVLGGGGEKEGEGLVEGCEGGGGMWERCSSLLETHSLIRR
jgi:hypothetical protein